MPNNHASSIVSASRSLSEITTPPLNPQERRHEKALRRKPGSVRFSARNLVKRHWTSIAMLLTIAILSAEPSYADTIFERVAFKVEAILTGPLTRTLAIAAIILMGVAAALGRVTADQVVIVMVGICLLLGAVSLVSMFA